MSLLSFHGPVNSISSKAMALGLLLSILTMSLRLSLLRCGEAQAQGEADSGLHQSRPGQGPTSPN